MCSWIGAYVNFNNDLMDYFVWGFADWSPFNPLTEIDVKYKGWWYWSKLNLPQTTHCNIGYKESA